MTVSVIIPHLRGEELLLNILSDLEAERRELPGLEVLVVDNASVDGSVEAAKEAYPWVQVLKLPRNEGYAGGCNRGVEATSGAWVWLLNDDVRLERGVVPEVLRVAGSSEDVAAVQPKILSMLNKEHFDYAGGAGGLIDFFGYPFALGRLGGVLERDDGRYDQVREIFWASGTACLWRRKALEDVGLLDESFFAHMEEIDLAWRAWNAGWRILSAPGKRVYHLGGGTLAYQAWRKMYLNHRNSLAALIKNRDRRVLAWLLPTRLLMDNAIGLGEAVLGRPGRLWAVWRGWFSFLLWLPRLLQQRKNHVVRIDRSTLDNRGIVYRGSILLAYARGVRSASLLVAQQDEGT